MDLLKQMRLDIPPITELAAMLHKEAVDIPQDILTVEEMVMQLWP